VTAFQVIEGDVLLRDAAGNPIVVRADGTYYQLATSDQATHDLLTQVLTELKKLNLHLTLINGEGVKDHDVD
jgi:hypothetical protein